MDGFDCLLSYFWPKHWIVTEIIHTHTRFGRDVDRTGEWRTFYMKTVNLCIISVFEWKIAGLILSHTAISLFLFIFIWMLTHQIQLENLEITNGKMFVFKVDWIAWAHTQNVLCIFGLSLSLALSIQCLISVDYLFNQSTIRWQRHQFEARIWHFFLDLF